MRSIEEIEADIEKLPPDQIERLAEWLTEFRARAWDRQIAEDAGPNCALRRFVDEALSEFKARKTRRLR